MRHRNYQFYGIITMLFLICLTASIGETATKKTDVFVSIIPQKYFVERIGGQHVNVHVLVKPGQSPATYEPTPRQMAGLSKAELYFRIGVAFETPIIPKIRDTYKNVTIVNTQSGIELRKMQTHRPHDEISEDHSDSHANHEHTGTDPHIWLDPELVMIQARTITDALIKIDPDAGDVYEKNYEEFIADLKKLDETLKKVLNPVKGKTLLVFHPAWGYFADSYGLKQLAVEIEGKDPSARYLARVIDHAKAENVSVIFVQSQFSQANANTIAEAINGVVVPIDPLAENYIENLEIIAEKIGKLLKSQEIPMN